jgi:hypothetical protein
MSKGYGKTQRFWIQIASSKECIKEPWSFDGICRSVLKCDPAKMRPSLKRSLRRALQGLVKAHMIIYLGTGRGSLGYRGYRPARYVLNPQLLDNKDPRKKHLVAHLAKCGIKLAA